MAATATQHGGDATAVLDKIQPPEGVVIPPLGIREDIDKTADFVIRRGVVLEMRIRENRGADPKFSFLKPEDPYNAWYEWRKSEFQDGRGTTTAAGGAGEGAKPVREAPKGPEKPPDFRFSARMPRMNQKDLEVLRLTALFVARNGRQFMTQLAQRENGNPQFAFLIPNHTFHNVFQSMVDQYGILIKETGPAQEARMEELKRNVQDKFHVLNRTKQRAEYAKWQEAEKKKKEEEEEKKKMEFSSIDWNDFVLVETIAFTEADDAINLPPPTTLNDLQYASLEEKNKFSISSNLRIEEAFPLEETSFNAYPPQNYGAQWQPPAANGGQNTYPAAAPSAGPNAGAPYATTREDEEAQRIKEREESRVRVQQAQADARARVAPGRIKENYIPKAAQRAQSRVQMPVCPNCKQQIPENELDHHMRIEMLDPRWKEQKAKAEARQVSTGASVDVANNLKRLVSQRGDVFDQVTGRPLPSAEEEERRKRVALNSFDGQMDQKPKSSHMQPVNVEEQIRHIHQKFASDGHK